MFPCYTKQKYSILIIRIKFRKYWNMEKFETIGEWSEDKLDILGKYSHAYTTILNKHKLTSIYVDAFAGKGEYRSKKTGNKIKGSALNALTIKPSFDVYYFVEMDLKKVDTLEDKVGSQKNVTIFKGDCSKILLNDVLPNIEYSQFKRGLCFLDPYGIHLDWTVIKAAAEMGTIELFVNFSIMDINRNFKKADISEVRPSDMQRMNQTCGSDDWKNFLFDTSMSLFGDVSEKKSNEDIAKWFQNRLKQVAGFSYVPKPIPMKNSIGRTVYYLYFASQNNTADKIIKDIFSKYGR